MGSDFVREGGILDIGPCVHGCQTQSHGKRVATATRSPLEMRRCITNEIGDVTYVREADDPVIFLIRSENGSECLLRRSGATPQDAEVSLPNLVRAWTSCCPNGCIN